MENKRTCLYDKHVQLGALMSPFGGFDMPIQYSSIIEEHHAVRERAGVFDVSHMGEVAISGDDAERFVNHIFTNDITLMPEASMSGNLVSKGKIQYGMMCYEDGGVVDDLLVYKYTKDRYFLVINASNIDKDLAWIRQQAEGYTVTIEDKCSLGQIALQGPDAEMIMEETLHLCCKELDFYTFKETIDSNEPSSRLIISRTGYTGEDGFEIYGAPESIRELWDQLIAAGVQPCGLGCRDTLRFEVGLPLYGDELSEYISPIMAGLGIFVKLDKQEFIGKEALARQKAEGVSMKLVGIELKDKAIPRHGYAVLRDGQEIGTITTGYHSISADKSVAMALVKSEFSALGSPVEVQIRKKTFPGVIVKKKFYEKHYKE